jgi:hypothetical protein
LLIACSIACSSGAERPASYDLAYLDGDGAVWLADSDSGKTQRLERRAQCRGANNVAWSPRGDRIACFWPENGEMRLLNGDGFLLLSAEGVFNFGWSSTGDYFHYTAGNESRLRIADADGQEIGSVEARIDSSGRWRPAFWLEDGSALLYSDPSGHIWFYDVQSKQQRDPIVWGSYDSWVMARNTMVVIEQASSGKELVAKVYDVRGRDRWLDHRLTLAIGYGSAALSADGTKLAVQVGIEVDVFDLSSGATEASARLILCDCDAPPGIVFSPDGAFVYWEGRPETSSSGRALHRARTNGNDRQKLFELASPYAGVSGDLTKVAYLEGEATSLKQLWVLDIESGNRRRIASEAVVFGWASKR